MDFHLLNSELLKLRVFDGKQYKGKEKPEKKRGSRIWRTLKAELRNLGNKEPLMILNLNLHESLPLRPQLCHSIFHLRDYSLPPYKRRGNKKSTLHE